MQYQIVVFGIAAQKPCTANWVTRFRGELWPEKPNAQTETEEVTRERREQRTTAQRRVPNEVIECKLQNCWRGRKAAKLQLQLQVNKLLRLVAVVAAVLGPGPHFQLSHSRTAEREREGERTKERQLSDNESEQPIVCLVVGNLMRPNWTF